MGECTLAVRAILQFLMDRTFLKDFMKQACEHSTGNLLQAFVLQHSLIHLPSRIWTESATQLGLRIPCIQQENLGPSAFPKRSVVNELDDEHKLNPLLLSSA